MRLKARGNYLGSGTGIVFVVIGRRILGGKPGVPQKVTSVISVSVVHERNKVTLLSLSEHQREYQRVPAE